jgi:hypothetical protein
VDAARLALAIPFPFGHFSHAGVLLIRELIAFSPCFPDIAHAPA